MNVLTAVGYNLANLLNFAGRQSRSRFWPYAIFVLVLVMGGTMAVMLPEIAGSFLRMQRFAEEHPDQSTVEVGPGSYSISIQGHHPELMPNTAVLIPMLGLVFAVAAALLAAAVARRLHDSGKSALRGLLPVPFITFAFAIMPGLFNATNPNIGLFLALFINNMLYLASLVLLVVWLAAPGTAGDNRYGPGPA